MTSKLASIAAGFLTAYTVFLALTTPTIGKETVYLWILSVLVSCNASKGIKLPINGTLYIGNAA